MSFRRGTEEETLRCHSALKEELAAKPRKGTREPSVHVTGMAPHCDSDHGKLSPRSVVAREERAGRAQRAFGTASLLCVALELWLHVTMHSSKPTE